MAYNGILCKNIRTQLRITIANQYYKVLDKELYVSLLEYYYTSSKSNIIMSDRGKDIKILIGQLSFLHLVCHLNDSMHNYTLSYSCLLTVVICRVTQYYLFAQCFVINSWKNYKKYNLYFRNCLNPSELCIAIYLFMHLFMLASQLYSCR